MPISPGLFDELLKENISPGGMFSDGVLLRLLTKALVERALQGTLYY